MTCGKFPTGSEVRLTLIRHAESEANVSGRAGGQGPSPLTPLGVEQALRLRPRTRLLAHDRLIATDLERVRRTVELAFGPDAQVELDPRWRERDFGAWEGRTWDEIRGLHPQILETWGAEAFEFRPEGGESWADVGRRAIAALGDIMSSESVVVVAHGGPIRLATCHLLGIDPVTSMWSFELRNTAICTFQVAKDRTRLVGWNDVLHLDASVSFDGRVPV